MIVLGGGLSDGNRHNHDELPIVLAGKGGAPSSGPTHPRQEKRPDQSVPVMLDRVGVQRKSSAHTGKLESLS